MKPRRILAVALAALLLAGCGNEAPSKPPAQKAAPAPAGPKTGDCLTFPSGQKIFYDAQVVDCAKPHEAEILATYVMPAGSYPGGAPLEAAGQDECKRRFKGLVGTVEPVLGGRVIAMYPMEAAWAGGDRTMRCAAAARRGVDLTGPLGDQARQLRRLSELRPGDCFDRVKGEEFTARLIDCGKPHEGQVSGLVPLPGADHPGDEKLHRIARKGCDRVHDVMRWRSVETMRLKAWYAFPGNLDWELQDKHVAVCYMTGKLTELLPLG